MNMVMYFGVYFFFLKCSIILIFKIRALFKELTYAQSKLKIQTMPKRYIMKHKSLGTPRTAVPLLETDQFSKFLFIFLKIFCAHTASICVCECACAHVPTHMTCLKNFWDIP